ncbi:MAG: AAA family ATPase, partial [Patescibacteria group bacterium]|nr:AAA family ATPase [Patescibacteria group bacterium]
MYLEKLEINGFKSFASKNKLIFSGILENEKRGLTAIVGPNGSGKSNVADAIRWVLGEQSAKTLRGKKGEDVIFSGSDKKARLGMAEVSLILNNQEKIINTNIKASDDKSEEDKENDDKLNSIIKDCDEISITRRLYRNGDSEYLINGNRSRLSDIQMLLAKAKFGQKTYSVIGQGMVENFLTASASERKDFFDEATGIKQFQIKRDSAINKLENSYENLQQVDMLLTEVKPRLRSLTRQVEKLKKREDLEIELKDNQTNYFSILWHDIDSKFNLANNEYLKIEKEKIEKENKLDKLNEELNKLRTTNNFNLINELEPKLKEKENQKNSILKQIAKIQAEMEAKLEAQGQYDVSWLSNKQSQLQKELENNKLEIQSLENSKKSQEQSYILQNINDLNAKLRDNNNIFKEINILKNKQEEEERKIAKAQTIIEANLEIQKRFDISKLKEKEENYLKIINSIEIAVKEINEQKDLKLKKELEEKINKINLEVNKLNTGLGEIKKRIESEENELNSKEEIESLIDEFLDRLDEISKENDISKVKKLVAEAKEDFRIKIKALIAGENLEELEELRSVQERIIKLTEEKQNLNSKLNEENLRLERINEKEKTLLEKKREINNFLNDVRSDLNQAYTSFNKDELEENIRESKKEIKEISNKIIELKQKINKDEVVKQLREQEEKLQNWKIEESSRLERLKLLENKKSSTVDEIKDIEEKLKKSQIKFDAETIKKEEKELKNKIETIDKYINEINERLSKLNEARNEEKNK